MFNMLPFMKYPFSEYDQNIQPITEWFTTSYQVNIKGDMDVEKEVATQVASNGRQLGIIIDALLALAESSDSEEVQKLRDLHAEIEMIKSKHKTELKDRIIRDMRSLKRRDTEAFEALKKHLEVV